MNKEFWCKKIGIFLHDPFEKNHVMIAKEEGGHEKRAEKRLGEVLKALNCSKSANSLIVEAKAYDVLSSTLDRWVVMSDKGRGSLPKKVKFINPFDPSFTHEVSLELNDKNVEEFYRTLVEIVGTLAKFSNEPEKIAFHILYGLAEPLWYEKVREIQVADTRSPTHTIFDHLSASVGMSNIYDGKKFQGFLVEVDVPGIQSFIAGGRGPGDLWIRSWLISALVWYMIKELVWELGPDIMLSPTARYNPFYYSLLREKLLPLIERASNVNVDKNLKELLKEFLEKLPQPSQPVMPGTVTLLLPKEVLDIEEIKRNYTKICENKSKCSEEDLEKALEEYFARRLREAWEKIVEPLMSFLNDLKNKIHEMKENGEFESGEEPCIVLRDQTITITTQCEDNERTSGDVIEKLNEAIETIKENPPLKPMVTVIEIRKAYEEFEKEFDGIKKDSFKDKYYNEIVERFKELKSKIGKEEFFPYAHDEDEFWEDLKRKLFFHWLLTNKYISKVQEKKRVSVSNRAREEWSCRISEEVYDNGIANAKVCACGRPAIIHNETDYFISPLRPREVLCPYCLAMRVAQYRGNVFEELVGKHDGKSVKAPRVQVRTLAALPELSKYLIEKGKVKPEDIDYKDFAKILRVSATASETKYGVFDLEDVIEQLKEEKEKSKVLKAVGSEEEDFIITLDAGDLAFLENGTNRYLAMIKADADGMGDLKSGRLNMKPKDYFAKLLSASVRDEAQASESISQIASFIEMIIERFYEHFYPAQAGIEVDERGNLKKEIKRPTENLPSTLVTPSYVYQLSYSLMIEALRDKDIVLDNYGIVVYSGGDDLLALVPARALYRGKCMEPLDKRHLAQHLYDFIKENYCSPALWVWWLTRLNHWGMTEEPKGFFESSHYFAPALLAYGRKYGVAIRHYRDPLTIVFEDADELESLAKNFKKKFVHAEIEKDGVAVSYGRAGAIEGGALPNSLLVKRKEELGVNYAPVKDQRSDEPLYRLGEFVAKLTNLINDKDGCLSKSFINDLERAIAELCEDEHEVSPDALLESMKNIWIMVVKRNSKGNCEAEEIVREAFERLKEEQTMVKKGDNYLSYDKSKVIFACELVKFLREWIKASR